MVNKTLKVLIFLCGLILVSGLMLTACGGKTSLKNLDITIGNWFEDYDVNDVKPNNDIEEQVLAWRTKIQKDNGFTMREKNVGSYGEFNNGMVVNHIMSGSSEAQVYVLQANWAMALMAQNLLYPVSDNKVVDFSKREPVQQGVLPVEWNQSTYKDFTFGGGKTYAFSVGINHNNVQVVFFNKRLFREAGLAPDLLYDLQKEGTWTWDKFLEIAKVLTRDTNNDGIIDTYATTRDFATDILSSFLSSNGAQYVRKDAQTGKFYSAIHTPEFLEGLQFAINLEREGVMKPKPEGANWDWFKSEFADGNVAMRIEESYVWNELQHMKDDWGVVLPPKGPRATKYTVYTRENVMVIPSTYDLDMVNKIMYAVQLWYTPVSDDWKSAEYNRFRDSRAVDETLALIRNTDLHMSKYFVFINGLQRGDIAWQMWYHDGDPAQLIEKVSQAWEALIEDNNF